jgi:hypothetical protein
MEKSSCPWRNRDNLFSGEAAVERSAAAFPLENPHGSSISHSKASIAAGNRGLLLPMLTIWFVRRSPLRIA